MIYRPAVSKNTHYTKLPNVLLRGGVSASEAREDGITPEALGVLVYLLSHVDDWQVTQAQLCKNAVHNKVPRDWRLSKKGGLPWC